MLLRDTNPLEPTGEDRDVDANRLIEIQAFAPVDPDPANMMAMNVEGGARFDVPLRKADERRRQAIARDVDVLCAEIGRWRHGCSPRWMPLGTPHLMGSCRMGRDPTTSVADTTGRVHGTENVFLAGTGTIPNRLAVNPTLTAAALAIHTADTLAGLPG